MENVGYISGLEFGENLKRILMDTSFFNTIEEPISMICFFNRKYSFWELDYRNENFIRGLKKGLDDNKIPELTESFVEWFIELLGHYNNTFPLDADLLNESVECIYGRMIGYEISISRRTTSDRRPVFNMLFEYITLWETYYLNKDFAKGLKCGLTKTPYMHRGLKEEDIPELTDNIIKWYKLLDELLDSRLDPKKRKRREKLGYQSGLNIGKIVHKMILNKPKGKFSKGLLHKGNSEKWNEYYKEEEFLKGLKMGLNSYPYIEIKEGYFTELPNSLKEWLSFIFH